MGKPETRAVDKRMRFVSEVEAREETMTELCRRFGWSRKTGHKWLERYRCEGLDGLVDRSRAPHEHPHAVAAEVASRCLLVRHAHPTWGPVKVRAWLERNYPEVAWPAASTIGMLFDSAGLTRPRKRRRRAVPSGPLFACSGPNDVWCIDFKGWFLTGDGRRCEPLTLSDAHSRYLLHCLAVPRTDSKHVWPVLDAAFRDYGLPLRLRSDNGPPFASTGAAGLSRLAVNVIKAGVLPERIAPGKPEQNGRLERLHLTLLRDAAQPPARTLREQLDRLRAFQRLYNEERPHAALDNSTPSEHYAPSPRRWDGVLREPDYPIGHALRRVRPNGAIRWREAEVYLTQALAGEAVALAERDGGSWAVYYGPIELGIIDHRAPRLRKPKPPAYGFVDNPDGLPTTPQAQQPQQPS
jgi:putative transposase